MKWSFNHKSRKAFLTAAICLALSQSVFAMPTGGKVVDGNVEGIVNGTVASGGTINVNSNALIDWTKFDIGKNETLNFAFNQNYLNVINHVTGSEMSQLLGTLTSGKNGNVYLINPNGILVGGGARIDAGSLFLSTLDATDDQLMGIYKTDTWNLDLASKKDSQGLTIQNGANIQVGTFLGLLGNKVQIADNVTISDTPYDKDETTLVVAAADSASFYPHSSAPALISVTTKQGNAVDMGATKFNINNEYTDTYILGNDIKMTGTNLNINSRNSKVSSTALDIIAADSYQSSKANSKANTENVELGINRGNHLDLSGVTASSDYMHVIGGRTSIDDSKLELTATTEAFKQGEPAPYMTIAALRGDHLILDDIEGGVQNVLNTQDEKNPAVANSLTIKNSDLTSNENLSLWGGSVELVNSNLKTATETNDKDNNIDIYAFESVDNDGGALTNSSNTVKVTGGSIESGADISMRGAKIALDGVDKVAGTGEKSAVELLAGKTIQTEDPDTIEINGTENNTIDINNTNITSNDGTLAYGGAINIASSSMKDNNYSIQIAAANYYLDDRTSYTDGKDSGKPCFLASTNNSVTLDNAQLTTSAKGHDRVTSIGVMSGNVTVKNKSTLDSGDIWLTAGKSYEDKNTKQVLSAEQGMNLTVSDSTIKASEDATLVGANVGLTNTSLTVGTEGQGTTGTNGIVRLAAGQDVTLYDQDGRGFGIESVDKTGNLTMNEVTLSAQGDVMAYGNNVTVNASDIKTQNSTGKENDLSLNALNHYERKDGSDDTWEAGKDNTLTVTDSKLTNNDMVELVGGNVALDNAEITAGDASVAARSGYKSVEVNKDNDTTVLRHDAADGMNVSIKDSKITSESGLDITGHDVTIDGKTNLSAKDFLAVGTGSAITTDFEKNTVTTPDGKAVKVSKDTTFESDHKVIVPGTEVIDNTKPSDPGTQPSVPGTKPSDPGTKPSDPGTKPSDPGTKPSNPGTKPSDPGTKPTDPGTKPSDPGTKPTEPDQPTKPDKPVVTPDPKPAVDVEKNIEQGKQDMTKALADNKDNASAAVKQQAEKLSSSKMTDEEKAAQVKGYAEAIENSQASAEVKQALVKDTVKSFEPTQQSSLEAQNKQDEAAQNNNAQTAIPGGDLRI